MDQPEQAQAFQGRQIVVCVTFREFDGGPNDRIQRLFLDSIAQQTYSNFFLCVTNFREKKVRAVLEEYEIPFTFDQAQVDTKISLTCILEHGIRKLQPGNSILMYTNADHIYPAHFLETVAREFEPGCAGTSYPQIVYNTVSDFQRERPFFHPEATPGPAGRSPFPAHEEGLPDWLQMDPNQWCMDVTFVDGDLLLVPENRQRYERFRFDQFWPGPAQSVIVTSYAPRELRKNIFMKARYAELQNVYSESQSADAKKDYVELRKAEFSHVEDLRQVMFAFARDAGFDTSEFSDPFLAKVRHAARYSIVGTPQEQELYSMYLGYWQGRYGLLHSGTLDQGRAVLDRMKTLIRQSYETIERAARAA